MTMQYLSLYNREFPATENGDRAKLVVVGTLKFVRAGAIVTHPEIPHVLSHIPYYLITTLITHSSSSLLVMLLRGNHIDA